MKVSQVLRPTLGGQTGVSQETWLGEGYLWLMQWCNVDDDDDDDGGDDSDDYLHIVWKGHSLWLMQYLFHSAMSCTIAVILTLGKLGFIQITNLFCRLTMIAIIIPFVVVQMPIVKIYDIILL